MVSLSGISSITASQFVSLGFSSLAVVLNAIQARVLWRGAQDLVGFEKAYNVQRYFNAINIAVNLWSVHTLVQVIGEDSISYSGLAMIGLGVSVLALTYINGISDTYFRTPSSLDETKAQIKLKPKETFFLRWGRPFLAHHFAQLIYVSQLCLNLALAIFSSSPLFYVINLALNGYALYAFARRNWVQVVRERIYEQSENNKIQSILVSFHCFFMPAATSKKPTAEVCHHCKEGSPDTYFHQNHLFHEKCLIQYLVKKSDDLTEISNIKDLRFAEQRINTRFWYAALKAYRPGCPCCAQEPFYNEMTFHLTHFNPGSQTAYIRWEDTPIDARALQAGLLNGSFES